MAWHKRLGRHSSLSALDDHIMRIIVLSLLECPVLVPDDYPTVAKAVEAAVDGQTILVRTGEHFLGPNASKPVVISKRLNLVGEDGAVLNGGLRMSFGSGGVLRNITVKGHLWIYDGRWDVSDCVVQMRQDACVLLSNTSRVRVRRCVVGGTSKYQASCGFIVYGHAVAVVSDCEVEHCAKGVSTGGKSSLLMSSCDIRDCVCAFSVLHPGDHGRLLRVRDCEIIRSGRLWLDQYRPERVEAEENKINQESMGRTFWQRYASTVGSWETYADYPGSLEF
ncbi:hypothetical protein GUITHDRAFT_118368 [Guillardia theta CCMP2712]|uniref:Right handed beta helix domain-containing protein n=1 Tax=Guillardia theta (strain CCMP2712) TaxID=905079 RepID=L1IH88_GUITC|nr:hypothetical protein GUITHDRAFT_118368 [Guillardia theta CCMP2712]EKX35452.1 hypothetical protein GUITHDRAFT_118368 [Guillardia theta CCMP2712]|eukprot:XP_005822432.1 hypothetical protein GUITHDRAFT_118368 [Guillardia theta CCMP2712]